MLSRVGTFAFACHQRHQFQLDDTLCFLPVFTIIKLYPYIYKIYYIYKGKISFCLVRRAMSLLKLMTLMTLIRLLFSVC